MVQPNDRTLMTSTRIAARRAPVGSDKRPGREAHEPGFEQGQGPERAGVRPRARSVASSRVRSVCSAMSALQTPTKATSDGQQAQGLGHREGAVEDAERLASQGASSRHPEGGPGESACAAAATSAGPGPRHVDGERVPAVVPETLVDLAAMRTVPRSVA